jgi:hypothetical protein
VPVRPDTVMGDGYSVAAAATGGADTAGSSRPIEAAFENVVWADAGIASQAIGAANMATPTHTPRNLKVPRRRIAAVKYPN